MLLSSEKFTVHGIQATAPGKQRVWLSPHSTAELSVAGQLLRYWFGKTNQCLYLALEICGPFVTPFLLPCELGDTIVSQLHIGHAPQVDTWSARWLGGVVEGIGKIGR